MTTDTTTQILNLASSELVLGQMNPYVINLLVGGFVLISVVMILIVLIQRPQGGGLGGAFGAGGGGGGGGGGGAGQTAFGTKTGDVLTGGTIAIFVMFIVFAVILNFATRPPEARPPQPTIASPTTTESIPVEDDENALDALGDLVDENQTETDADESVNPAEDAAAQEPVPQTDP